MIGPRPEQSLAEYVEELEGQVALLAKKLALTRALPTPEFPQSAADEIAELIRMNEGQQQAVADAYEDRRRALRLARKRGQMAGLLEVLRAENEQLRDQNEALDCCVVALCEMAKKGAL